MPHELTVVKSKFSHDLSGIYQAYGLPWQLNIYAVQVGWTAAGCVCAVMWMACCAAQLFWYIVRLGKPKSATNMHDFPVPERLGNISLAVTGVITAVLFFLQSKLGETDVSLIFLAAVIQAAVVSVVMRYR